MYRPLHASLLALVVVAAVGVPVLSADAGEVASPFPPLGDAAMDVGPTAPNGTNATVTRLGLDGPTTEGFLVPSPGAGAAVRIGDRELRGQLLGYEILQRIREADTAAANRTAMRRGLDDFQEHVELLRDVEAGAIQAFYSGAIGTDELLRRMARVDAEAGSTTAVLRHVREQARAIDGDAVTFSLRARSFSIARDLSGFETPIRDLLEETYRGGETGPRVHAVASENGLVLETIHDGTYVRDAVRTDHYDPTEPPTIGRSEAISMIFERYPTLATNSSVNGPNQIAGRLWQIRIRYPEGETTVYLDRSTEKVYREVHRLDLDDLRTETLVSRADGGLEVVINRTPEGNPYQVRVLDSRTGDPVDATVAVAGETVGTTGADGVLWTLGERGEFQFSVRSDTQTINVTVGGNSGG